MVYNQARQVSSYFLTWKPSFKKWKLPKWIIAFSNCVGSFCTESYIHKWHVGLLCKTLQIIQILLNCLILCGFRINWSELCLNNSWNCLVWILSTSELEFFENRDRLIKRVDFSKIQPENKRAAKANFICWTLFWPKCWKWLFFPVNWYFSYVQVFDEELSTFFTLVETRFLFTTGTSHWFWKATRWVVLIEPPPACLSSRTSKLSIQKCFFYLSILVGVVNLNPPFTFSCASSA